MYLDSHEFLHFFLSFLHFFLHFLHFFLHFFLFAHALLHMMWDFEHSSLHSSSRFVHGGGGGGGGEGAGGDRGGAGAHVMADVSERAKCTVATMKLRLAAPAVVPSHFVRSAISRPKQAGVVPGLRKNGSKGGTGNSHAESPGATNNPGGPDGC